MCCGLWCNAMSKQQFDGDGFKIVSKKRCFKSHAKKIQSPLIDTVHSREDTALDITKAIRRIETAAEDLRSSDYSENVLKSVSNAIQCRKVVEIVCFGLGHIGVCNISRHQLALLLHLKKSFVPQKVLIQDPIFYTSECQILKDLGLELINQNIEGSYIISDKGVTIVYLPHCPKQLTNNFLWCNWGPQLENCIFICNSFTSLIENQPSRILYDSASYICKLHPYTTEVPLENNFRYTDIFNDTSIHYFSNENLKVLHSDFWIKGEKPKYEDNEEFITSLMIENLNLY